jgi:hypothetical protein
MHSWVAASHQARCRLHSFVGGCCPNIPQISASTAEQPILEALQSTTRTVQHCVNMCQCIHCFPLGSVSLDSLGSLRTWAMPDITAARPFPVRGVGKGTPSIFLGLAGKPSWRRLYTNDRHEGLWDTCEVVACLELSVLGSTGRSC